MTIKNVALSTALDLNKDFLDNMKIIKEAIEKDVLSKTPQDLHHLIVQSFKSSIKDKALNSVKSKKDLMDVLHKDLVWIPPQEIFLDEDGNRSDQLRMDENESFFYVPIEETLKELAKYQTLKFSSNLGTNNLNFSYFVEG